MKRDPEISAAIATAIEPIVSELAADLGKLLTDHVKSQLAEAKRFAIEKLTSQLAGNADEDRDIDPDLEPETEVDPARHPRAPKNRAQQKRARAAAKVAKVAKPTKSPPAGKLTVNGKRLPTCRKCGFYGGNTRGCGRSHPTQQKPATSSSSDSEDESRAPRKRPSRAIEPEPERVIPHAALVAMLAADRARELADAGDAGGFVARADRAPSLIGHTEEKREVCPTHGWVGRVAFEREQHEHCRPVGDPCRVCDGRRVVMGDFCSRCEGSGVEPPPSDEPTEPPPDEPPLLAVPGVALIKSGKTNTRRVADRSETLAAGDITLTDLAAGAAEVELAGPPVDEPRPRVRGDCASMPRPCPYVSCRYHLYLDVNPLNGTIKLNFPRNEPDEMIESCALDVADRGGVTLESIGNLSNLTRERARQIETKALKRAYETCRALRIKPEDALAFANAAGFLPEEGPG